MTLLACWRGIRLVSLWLHDLLPPQLIIKRKWWLRRACASPGISFFCNPFLAVLSPPTFNGLMKLMFASLSYNDADCLLLPLTTRDCPQRNDCVYLHSIIDGRILRIKCYVSLGADCHLWPPTIIVIICLCYFCRSPKCKLANRLCCCNSMPPKAPISISMYWIAIGCEVIRSLLRHTCFFLSKW